MSKPMSQRKVTDTEGRRLLAKLVSEGTTQTAISAALKAAGASTTQVAVSFWCSGATRPPAVLRAVLDRLFSIPQEAWLSDDERALVDALPVQMSSEDEDLLEWTPIHSKKSATN